MANTERHKTIAEYLRPSPASEKSTLSTYQNEKNQNRQKISNQFKNSAVHKQINIMMISAIKIEKLVLEREIL